MKVAIRIDDITPDMNWDNFEKFREILIKQNIKPVIGVVPDNQDETLQLNQSKADFWERIRQYEQDGWVIAMHGFSHCYSTKKGGIFPLNHFSEFAGVSYEKQLQMIRRGKEIFGEHNIETKLFMAPGHSFDYQTLKALRECGFLAITDGFGRAPYSRKGMIFFPIAYWQKKLFESKRKGITTWVFHLNNMKPEEFDRIEKSIEQNRDKLVDYSTFWEIQPYRLGLTGRCVERIAADVKRILVSVKRNK